MSDREWLKKMAEREGGDFVSVGGWVHDLEAAETGLNEPCSCAECGRMVELSTLSACRQCRRLVCPRCIQDRVCDGCEAI